MTLSGCQIGQRSFRAMAEVRPPPFRVCLPITPTIFSARAQHHVGSGADPKIVITSMPALGSSVSYKHCGRRQRRQLARHRQDWLRYAIVCPLASTDPPLSTTRNFFSPRAAAITSTSDTLSLVNSIALVRIGNDDVRQRRLSDVA